MMKLIDWVTNDTPDDIDSYSYALMLAMAIPLLSVFCHITGEFFRFYVIEVGHRIHTSLKQILFAKNLRMSNASNKDFDSSEIESIIMRDTDVVWSILW